MRLCKACGGDGAICKIKTPHRIRRRAGVRAAVRAGDRAPASELLVGREATGGGQERWCGGGWAGGGERRRSNEGQQRLQSWLLAAVGRSNGSCRGFFPVAHAATSSRHLRGWSSDCKIAIVRLP
ncbi:unnamed protein product [Closterium sp. Yama58-4]|nr:unnamed protein product [Closterium sp. Yama58-4]